MTRLLQITAPHFCACIVLEADEKGVMRAARGAPILAYMRLQRWDEAHVREYCRRKGWSVQHVPWMGKEESDGIRN